MHTVRRNKRASPNVTLSRRAGELGHKTLGRRRYGEASFKHTYMIIIFFKFEVNIDYCIIWAYKGFVSGAMGVYVFIMLVI